MQNYYKLNHRQKNVYLCMKNRGVLPDIIEPSFKFMYL